MLISLKMALRVLKICEKSSTSRETASQLHAVPTLNYVVRILVEYSSMNWPPMINQENMVTIVSGDQDALNNILLLV